MWRWHLQFTPHTARCSERPALSSTHITLYMFLTPRNVCVGYVPTGFTTESPLFFHPACGLIYAPQQISSFLGVSAQIQECQAALHLHSKAFS